jgi:hypothetical protein
MAAVPAVSNTVFGIINDAMHDAGYLGEGEIPNSEQLATYQRRLCDIINLWQTQGLKLFLMQDLEVPLVSGQNLYTLGPGGDVDMTKPLQAIQSYVLVADSEVRRPTFMIAWEDWLSLSQVEANPGAINSVFVDKQALLLKVYVWQTPDDDEALNTLHLLIRTQATNPTNLEENVSFPQEWRIALRWGLANDICSGQPQAIMDRCERNAEKYRDMLENWDVEDAPTSFTPDQRIGNDRNSFA